MKIIRFALLAAVVALTGCTAAFDPSAPTGGQTTAGPSTSAAVGVGECTLEPITPPTLPEQIPGYIEIDPATGLHMTGTPTEIEVTTYRLEVTGRVDHPLSLTYDQLRCLPRVEASPRLVCPGFFVDQAIWAGVPLREVLALAGVPAGASRLRLTAADGYWKEMDLTPELLDSAFLAYELNGETLPALHGFPLRLVVPDRDGNNWVKWLVSIEVS